LIIIPFFNIPTLLCTMKVDYLIAGCGLSGALLSRELIKAGCSVLVFDARAGNAASRVAGGIINPVTGKRLVRTWMIEELLPFAINCYKELEDELKINLIKDCSILDFYATQDQRNLFIEKAFLEKDFLKSDTDAESWEPYFRFYYGAGEILPCPLIDIRALLNEWQQQLTELNCFVEEQIDPALCKVNADKVLYKNIEAAKIIWCEGAEAEINPWFSMLPWSKDKGEAIIASIPGLPRNYIYKQYLAIVPWQCDDLFWIGATHDWKYTDLNPSRAFMENVKMQLDLWLKLPYTIIDHIVGRRPANLERKPFVGLHPLYPSVGILNGMGGKGVSMAPFFASEFTKHLTQGKPLRPDVDVKRFSRILSR